MSNLSRHQSYNNRFRTSTSSVDDSHTGTQVPKSPLQSLSEAVDLFGQSANLGRRLSFKTSVGEGEHVDDTTSSAHFQRATSLEQTSSCPQITSPVATTLVDTATPPGEAENTRATPRDSVVGDTPRPTAPGKPRRLSRQSSAGTRRQQFAASRSLSGKHTSGDSVCDDVFVEIGDGEGHHQHHHPHRHRHDSSLFPNVKGRREEVLSTSSSTTTVLPNPYNRLNHQLHSMVWCCSCLYFVFFCCLPAIHYMEQCDVEFNRNNQKKARRLGRVSTLLFLIGTLLTLLAFAFIFFLAIFFTIG